MVGCRWWWLSKTIKGGRKIDYSMENGEWFIFIIRLRYAVHFGSFWFGLVWKMIVELWLDFGFHSFIFPVYGISSISSISIAVSQVLLSSRLLRSLLFGIECGVWTMDSFYVL